MHVMARGKPSRHAVAVILGSADWRTVSKNTDEFQSATHNADQTVAAARHQEGAADIVPPQAPSMATVKLPVLCNFLQDC